MIPSRTVRDDSRFPYLFMDDDVTPATSADVRRLTDTMEHRFDAIDRKFHKVWEYFDKLMGALEKIDGRLSGKVSDHERRIVRLEQEVGLPS